MPLAVRVSDLMLVVTAMFFVGGNEGRMMDHRIAATQATSIAISATISTSLPVFFVFMIPNAGSLPKPCRLALMPLLEPEGEQVHVLVAVHDIRVNHSI